MFPAPKDNQMDLLDTNPQSTQGNVDRSFDHTFSIRDCNFGGATGLRPEQFALVMQQAID
jgi:hypothetical protein